MLKATLFWIVVFIVFVMGIKGFFLLMNSVSDDIQVSNKTQQQIQSSPTITESPLNLGHKKIELEGLIQEGVRLRNILITLNHHILLNEKQLILYLINYLTYPKDCQKITVYTILKQTKSSPVFH